jgi:transposase-like protein
LGNTRKRYNAALKARVVKGEKTIAQLASQYGVDLTPLNEPRF